MLYNSDSTERARVRVYQRKAPICAVIRKRTYYSTNSTPPATPATTGTGGNTPNPSTTTGGDESKTLDQNTNVSDPNQPNTEKTPISSLPVDVQTYINDLRKEAETYRKEKKAAEIAAKAAEEATLKQQQKWQELAERHEKRLAELEPVSQQLEEIQAAFEAGLTAKLEALPEDVRKELEPVRASMKPVDFSRWLDVMIPRFTRKPANLDAGAGGETGKRTLGKTDIKPVAY